MTSPAGWDPLGPATGSASIEDPDTSIDIEHRHPLTPNLSDIAVTPTNDLGAAAKWWTSDVDADTFRINIDAAAGSGLSADFAWQVNRDSATPPPDLGPTYDDIVLDDGATLYTPLDDTSGTTAVALIGSNGTYAGGPTLGVTGPTFVGSTGVSFDGVNDNMRATHTLAATCTIEVWFKVSALPASGIRHMLGFVDSDGGGSYSTVLYLNSAGAVGGYVHDGAAKHAGSGSVSTGVWHHAALVVQSGASITTYVDGVQTGTTAIGTPATGFGGAFMVGGATSVWGRHAFSFAAAAYYPTALLAGQIAEHAGV